MLVGFCVRTASGPQQRPSLCLIHDSSAYASIVPTVIVATALEAKLPDVGLGR